VRTHHKLQKSEVFAPKVQTFASEEPPCPQNTHTGQAPLFGTSFMGSP